MADGFGRYCSDGLFFLCSGGEGAVFAVVP